MQFSITNSKFDRKWIFYGRNTLNSKSSATCPYFFWYDRKYCNALVIGPYELPSGTTIWPNLYALHHEAAYWSDPFKFLPERYLDPKSGQFTGCPPNLKPFSGGPRTCLAERETKNNLYVSISDPER